MELWKGCRFEFGDILTIVHGGTQLLFCCVAQASGWAAGGSMGVLGTESVCPFVASVCPSINTYAGCPKPERVHRNTRFTHVDLKALVAHVFPLCYLTSSTPSNTYGRRTPGIRHITACMIIPAGAAQLLSRGRTRCYVLCRVLYGYRYCTYIVWTFSFVTREISCKQTSRRLLQNS